MYPENSLLRKHPCQPRAIAVQNGMANKKGIPLSAGMVERRMAEFGFVFPVAVAEGICIYLELLEKWNAVMNLVGFSHWEDILEKLICDSFHLESFLSGLPLSAEPEVWDLGAGAGLPGIPLRLVWQKGEYAMVEVREKRALFLRTALAACKTPRTRVVQARAEDFFLTAGQASLVISRAFMPWRKMLALVQERLTEDGMVVFLALTPLPPDLPAGWRALEERHYRAGGQDRHFWALRRTYGERHA